MGVFYYSTTKKKPSIVSLDVKIKEFTKDLFGDTIEVVKVEGVPINVGDDRKAKWMINESYSVSLLRDGRLEFKVPGSMFDALFDEQQRLRRKLVRFYNRA